MRNLLGLEELLADVGAVLGERAAYPLLKDGQPVPHETYAGNEHWGRLQFPEIWWWRVDPGTAKAERITPPSGAPLFMDDAMVARGLDWTYNASGDPVFASIRQVTAETGK